jgi:hypothetical protein
MSDHSTPANLNDKYAAYALYAELRALNPHLPPADLVTADALELGFGVDRLGTLRLSVFVKLPTTKEAWADGYGQGRDDEAQGLPLAESHPNPRTPGAD